MTSTSMCAISKNFEKGFLHGKTDLDEAWKPVSDEQATPDAERTIAPAAVTATTSIPMFAVDVPEENEHHKKLNVFNHERGLYIQRKKSLVSAAAAMRKQSVFGS
jgi:hypothetical protein